MDDTERKMRHCPHNLLVVPEFKDAKHRTDGSMSALLTYLLNLLDHRQAATSSYDIREYIRANPLKM